jgi:hypothetical protein
MVAVLEGRTVTKALTAKVYCDENLDPDPGPEPNLNLNLKLHLKGTASWSCQGRLCWFLKYYWLDNKFTLLSDIHFWNQLDSSSASLCLHLCFSCPAFSYLVLYYFVLSCLELSCPRDRGSYISNSSAGYLCDWNKNQSKSIGPKILTSYLLTWLTSITFSVSHCPTILRNAEMYYSNYYVVAIMHCMLYYIIIYRY